MNDINKKTTSQAASISLLVAIISFLTMIFGAQFLLPPYLFESSNYYVIAILLELIPLGIGVMVYLSLSNQRFSDVIVFSKPHAKINKPYMPWLIVLAGVMAIVSRNFVAGVQFAWLELLKSFGYKVAEISLPAVDNLGVFIVAILGIAVTPAIFEEIIFRGILQKGLLRHTSPKNAIIISSFMFMLMHGSVESLLYTFVFGCLLGYLAYKSGSIVPSIVFHFVNNGIAVILLYFMEIAEKFGIQVPDTSTISMNEVKVLAITSVISVVLVSATIIGYNKLAKSPPENPYLKAMEPKSIVLIVVSACILFTYIVTIALFQNVVF